MRRSESEAWLVLLRAPGVGAATLREIVARSGSAERALAAARRGDLRAESAECRAWIESPDRARIEDDLAWLDADGHALIAFSDPDYPALLAETGGAPAALFVAGDATALWQPQVAIVGSRSASHAGIEHARAFSKALARAGFAITSGLAEGIDGAAHEAALDAGAITIGVLGTGPDLVFPTRHRELAGRIVAAGGALVSEFPPGTPGRPENFPRRNRIIAGLSLGTLVVEAGLRSGSLITARLATDQGREVFAIPGSIHNPLARGCHQLIRQGATLTETAGEIIEALAPLATKLGAALRARLDAVDVATPAQPPRPDDRDADYARLLAALGHEPAAIDSLAARTGLDVASLSSMLLLLELEGEVASGPSGTYARVHGISRGA